MTTNNPTSPREEPDLTRPIIGIENRSAPDEVFDIMSDRIRGFLSRHPVKAASREGWKMVPRDITMEMIGAGEDEYNDPSPVSGPDGEDGDWFSPIQAAWYAMLAVSPTPDSQGES